MKIDMSKVGQIRDKRTMKFFIMTVLRSVGGHARPQDLDMITMMTDSANWFDYREALAELLETQHILSVELPGKGEFYVNSSLANDALEQFKREVPAFARGRINAAVLEFRAKMRYDNDIRSSIQMNDDGTAMLTPSQFWCIIMVLLGIGYFFLYKYVFKKMMKHPELQPPVNGKKAPAAAEGESTANDDAGSEK